MKTKEDIIEKFNLWPIVPIIDYDDYRCSWSDSNKNQVLLKDNEECKNYIPPRNKRITGYYIYTGEKSNIIVIDLDIGHKSNVNGINNFNDIITNLPVEDQKVINNTLTVLTKRNGIHLYFKYNSEINKKVSFDGIDIITNGCLAPIPGSKRRIDPPNNKKIGTYELLFDYPIQPMPQSLIDVIKQHYSKPKEKFKRGRPKEISRYYNPSHEGSRDNTLISWLGYMVKSNPNLRKKEELLPLAEMYNLRYLNPPLENNIVNDKVDSILKMVDPPYINEKGKIINGALSDTLISDIKYKYYMGKNYTYNGSFYKEWELTETLRRKIYTYVTTETESTKMANEVISLMQDKASVENSKDFEYITVNNGLLHLRSNTLVPHNESIFTTFKIDCEYKSDWKLDYEGSNIQRFLNTTFKNDKDLINMAIEIMGMSLLPNPSKCQKHILLMGEGNNGKSIYMNLIKSLHGNYVSTQPTDKLCDKKENKFCTSAMIGKRLNLVDDENDIYMKDTGLWKSIVTGGVVSIEYKGQTPTSGNLNTLLISGTNHVFKSKDNSEGFYRRFLILPFNQKFVPSHDLNLPINTNALPCDYSIEANILDNEMHILLGLALEGLFRVLRHNYKFKPIKATDETISKLKIENDPIYEFVNDLKKGEYFIDQITGTQFRFIYERWCDDNDKFDIGGKAFGNLIKKYYESKISHGRKYFNVDMPKEYMELLCNIKYSLKEIPIVEEIQSKEPVYNGVQVCNSIKL